MEKEVYREYTIGQILDAIEADAIAWTKGSLHKFNTRGEVTYACAIGIAAVNLGVDAGDLQSKLGGLGSTIIKYNDSENLSKALSEARKASKDRLFEKITIKSAYYASVVTPGATK